MSYFNQIIQRSESATQPATLLPSQSYNPFGPEDKTVEDPFIDYNDILPSSEVSTFPSIGSFISLPQAEFPREQINIPLFQPESIPEIKKAIYREPIKEIHSLRLSKKEGLSSEKTEKELNPLANPEAPVFPISPSLEKGSPLLQDEEGREKLRFSRREQEIPPVMPEELKPLKIPNQKPAEKVEVKKKAEAPVPSLRIEELRQSQPDKPNRPELKTALQPRSLEAYTAPPQRRAPEKKLSIGKITVEVIPPATPSKAPPARTIYRVSRPAGASGNTGSLRYNLRFGLGQL